jgi:predicted nucleic-acid-binding Zn-ribbon protein
MAADPIEQLGAKLDALVSHEPCAVCGHDRWALQPSVVPLPAPTPSAMFRRELPCIAVLCMRCGYVRFHSTQILEKGS